MYKVLDLLEGQGRTDSASSWGLHTFNVIRLVSKEYVYVVHNASLNTVKFWRGDDPSRHNGSICWQWTASCPRRSTLMLNLTERDCDCDGDGDGLMTCDTDRNLATLTLTQFSISNSCNVCLQLRSLPSFLPKQHLFISIMVFVFFQFLSTT